MSPRPSRETLAEIELPANATGAPITYMAGGKQHMAFPTGGGPLPILAAASTWFDQVDHPIGQNEPYGKALKDLTSYFGRGTS
jgi:hypothetical protein